MSPGILAVNTTSFVLTQQGLLFIQTRSQLQLQPHTQSPTQPQTQTLLAVPATR